jgi:hypothetical protein
MGRVGQTEPPPPGQTFMAEADFADGFSAQLDRALDAGSPPPPLMR